MSLRWCLVLVPLVAACNRSPAPEPVPAPAPQPAAPAPAAPEPPPVRELGAVLAEAVALEPGDRTVALLAGEPPVVDRGASFRVVLRGKFPDARLSLLDGRDALVASEGEREVGATTTLTLRPAAPLSPAATYLVRVDGVSVRRVHDEAGQEYEPLTAAVVVAGQPEPPPPPERRRRKR